MDVQGLKLVTNLEEEKDENNRLVLESGKEFSIKFNTEAPEKGELTAQVLGPNGRLLVSVENDQSLRVINFTPNHEGDHYIHLFWKGSPLSISPLLGHCQGPVLGVDPTKIALQGRGCSQGRATVPTEFIIDGSKGGEGVPEVHLHGVHNKIPVQLTKLKFNRYKCTYTAENAGSYLLYVNWSGKPIPTTPRKITIVPKGNVSLVKVTGKALTGGIAEQKMTIDVDTILAGSGYVEATCQNCHGQVRCDVIEKTPGLYSINVYPTIPGQYKLWLLYDRERVPGSPLVLRVGEPPDATQVKVWGPGTEDGILHSFDSHFLVETQGAGVGQLSIKLKGPKGGFKVNMKRHTTNNRTIVCSYEPTEVGQYEVSVMWSGVHVPKSPFKIKIHESSQELQMATMNQVGSKTAESSHDNLQWTEDI